MELLALESIITTHLKAEVPSILNNPNISFTNETSDKTPTLPNVYVHELDSSEVGNSIPNNVIHAIRDTIQIEATTNTNKADARKIINACVSVMKSLRYGLVASPVYTRINNTHRFVIRVRRVIANGDTF